VRGLCRLRRRPSFRCAVTQRARVPFFCVAKRKEPKKRPPGSAAAAAQRCPAKGRSPSAAKRMDARERPLLAAAGRSRRDSCPGWNVASIHARNPAGYSVCGCDARQRLTGVTKRQDSKNYHLLVGPRGRRRASQPRSVKAPKGAKPWMASFYRQHMDVLSAKPRRNREAQGTARCLRGAVIGSPFFWFLFFGDAKKRNTGALRHSASKTRASP